MIRPAERADAPALAELMTQLRYPTSAAEMERRLESILPNERFKTFVAEVDDCVSGMIGASATESYEHNDSTGRIVALVVSEEARRGGIGRELVRAAEQWFAENGISRISLTTRLDREAAHRFYEASGYTRTGLRFAKILS
jgi:ribosomal protein S18 acetylase RimI-like enzyme